MKILTQPRVKTHIISGFLGAGKTTLLQQILKQKPQHQTWAVLMNEFGQIGIDQQLLRQDPGYAIKEVLGGCLCCSSQLPMQLALSRLIHEQKPDRLFIETTGLGHPAQLIDQLNEPHWHSSLALQAPITVINGAELHTTPWLSHDLYADQLKAAQIVVISHQQLMQFEDQQALAELKQHFLTEVDTWLFSDQGQIELAQIDQPLHPRTRVLQPLLQRQQQQQRQLQQQGLADESPATEVIQTLPYHYTEQAQGYQVAGWRFSKRWVFEFYALLDCLTELQQWRRIKAIFRTDQGWISFNFNPDQFNYQSCAENLDNRIEVITQQPRDWAAFEAAVLNCRIESEIGEL